MSNFLIRATTLFTLIVADKPGSGGIGGPRRYPNMQDFGMSDKDLRVFASEKHLVVYDPSSLTVFGLAAPHSIKVDQRLVARNIIMGRVTRFWDNPDPKLAVYNTGGTCRIKEVLA